MSELKPCPFCGADAKVEDYGSFKIVGCSKLSMLCPNPRMTVYNNDFSHWNKREEAGGKQSIVDELYDSLERICSYLSEDGLETMGLTKEIVNAQAVLRKTHCNAPD